MQLRLAASYTVGSNKTLKNVLFGTVLYPGKVRLRYCCVTVAVLFRYCAVNVQVRYKSGGRFGTIRQSIGVGSLKTRYSVWPQTADLTCRIPCSY